MSGDDSQHMHRALALAARGLYTTDPNPRVGCVLVREGAVVGEGWHVRAGEPHAEVNALDAAGDRAAGSTAYVTLEPCSHHGRTGPCADALVAARVARVVVAMEDPDPRNRGHGLERLRAAGIPVESGLLAEDARALNPGFVLRHSRGRPWVRVKTAASLDGRTAMADGESKWITGPAARRDVQRLRARSSAILTGSGTVLADDPALTVRTAELGEDVPFEPPLRVVLDRRLRTPPEAAILRGPGTALVATAGEHGDRARAIAAAGAEVLRMDDGAGPQALLATLAQRGVNEVLVEAGTTLTGALVAAGLVDELVVYLAPVLLGDGARGMYHLPAIRRLAERVPLAVTDVARIGDDLRITATVRDPLP